jgi:hypothetical protein
MESIENISFTKFRRLMLEQQQKMVELEIKHDWLLLKNAIHPSNVQKDVFEGSIGKLGKLANLLVTLFVK